jgi:hypothetical protein
MDTSSSMFLNSPALNSNLGSPFNKMERIEEGGEESPMSSRHTLMSPSVSQGCISSPTEMQLSDDAEGTSSAL